MDKTNPIIQKLLSLNLPTDDFAVFGSGSMFAHGIKDLGHDIDLIARGKAWDMAVVLGKVAYSSLDNSPVVSLFDEKIEIFKTWAPGQWNLDELIETADVIDGLRFVTLDNVVKWKKMMGREKDFQHIKMIEEFLKKQK